METKPPVYSNSKFNINELPSDRRFEELMHRIFQYRFKDDLKDVFDNAYLMPGVAEKGVDILLQKNGKNEGTVQCKMITSGNINKSEAAKEIIKFALYYYQDNSLIHDLSTFRYFFCVSGKYAKTTILLLSDFSNKILNESDLQTWTEAVLKKYESFKDLSYDIIEQSLKKILIKLKITPISESEINKWLNDYPGIVSEFFEIKKVIENEGVIEELKKINNSLNPDLGEKLSNFLKQYYTSAISHLNTVKFIGYQTSIRNTPKNVTATELYVDHLLTYNHNDSNTYKIKRPSQGRARGKTIDLLDVIDIFKINKHNIILGYPGAGKSLLIKNLVLKIIKNDFKEDDKLIQIPIRIELRKYNEAKLKEASLNIISYVYQLLKSEYQLSDINNEVLLYLIQTYPTLFFFDGLDEIFDNTQKNKICDEIVNFISIYDKVSTLITSRFIGYHDISFPDGLFDEYSINNFNESQINEFIKKFYATQLSNEFDRKKEIENCKKQLVNVSSELKSNLLILSLMALLALNNIVIPDSKLEVYRSITQTLVEGRDKKEKELDFKLTVKSPRATFGALAFWQYSHQTLSDKKTTYTLAKKCINDYLIQKKEFEDFNEADSASKLFLEYAESRSIYFDNNFTHKTFLEYYTADSIFTRLYMGRREVELDELISKYISNSAWHIVLELLLAMIDEHLVENDVMEAILSKQIFSNNEETNYFLLSQLDKLTNISLELKSEILEETIIFLINNKLQPENYIYVSNLFEKLREFAQNEDFKFLIQKIIFKVEDIYHIDSKLIYFYTFVKELDNFKDYYTIKNVVKLNELAKLDKNLFIHLNEIDGVELLENFMKLFGRESIFDDISFKFLDNTVFLSCFGMYIDKFVTSENNLKEIYKIGLNNDIILEQSKLPLINPSNEKLKEISNLYSATNDNNVKKLLKWVVEENKQYFAI